MDEPLYEKSRPPEKSVLLAAVALVALVSVCFFYRIGGLPLVGKDEPPFPDQ